ncbi:MAG: hypothetical protein U0350_27935 [Caldilineaceae bacterium]
MRVDIPSSVMKVFRDPNLPPAVRQVIASLLTNPIPPDALPIPERPGRYEIFESDYWIQFEVLHDREETVAKVLLIESN